MKVYNVTRNEKGTVCHLPKIWLKRMADITWKFKHVAKELRLPALINVDKQTSEVPELHFLH